MPTLKQQKANRKKWVEALRSGEYQQAKGCLLNPRFGGYCCLGVAGTLLGIPDADLQNGSPCVESAYGTIQSSLGLRDALGAFGDGPHEGLARLNDKGASFAEIADIIESEPEGLFTS